MYRVMVRDNMSPLAKEILEATGKIEVVVDNNKNTNTPEALAEIIGEFDGLAVRSGTKVTAEVLEKSSRLKVIGRAGVGVDNIDVKAASKKGIVVMNAPGGNTVTTGEHAISLLLSLARNIPQGTASIRNGKWEKKQLTGVEITGKTLGIIGFGKIGQVVASRARGLRMKVLAVDPFISKSAAREMEVEKVELDELFSKSDFISLHVPSLKETVGMINADTISKMKPGVRIINCSRGDVIDLDALYQALESGHVGGAALDVFPVEPPSADLPVLSHPNAIFTPHLGASTGEAQIKVAEMIGNQMVSFLTENTIINAVNFPSVSLSMMDRLKPLLNLSEKMGLLMGQLVDGVHDLTITYTGDVAKLDTRPLTYSLLKGFLSAFTDVPINDVSAPALAREKGIHVTENVSHKVKDDFAGLIKLKLGGDPEGPSEIWGTVFAEKHPRIVRLGKIYMDAIPGGPMIVIQNIDKPGVIGNLGTTLGRHGINIGRFQLGRLEGRALCMVNIDSPAEDKVIEDIRSLPHIITVRQVNMK